MKLKDQVANAESAHQNLQGSSRSAEQVDQHRPALAEIGRRAYDIYIERGGTDGCDLDDWMQAERELWANHKSNETRLVLPGRRVAR